jgi:TolB-like protein/DNA-binding winged helix-turn-helix (wHTH) protein
VEARQSTIQTWRFGIFEVDARALEVRRSGTRVKMREQSFRTLVFLLEHAGELVSREELRRVLWPSGTFVDFDQSLNAAVMNLREALCDAAEAPIYIETIPKRGYRFIAPVETFMQCAPPDSGEKESAFNAGMNPGVNPGSHPPSPDTPHEDGFWIAVLPFISSGAELAATALGITEDVVIGLARFSYLRVISLSSTAQYAHHAVDVRTACKELGARYVLEGSLRQAAGRVRLSSKLVDTKSGAHLWAETYDRPFHPEGAFDFQDDVVPQIVSTIADTHGVLPRSMGDLLRTRDPEKLSPYEAVLRSFAHFQRVNAEEHAPSRDALERAVEQAPGYSDGWAMLSLIYKEEFTHGFNVRPDPLRRALAAAQRAVQAAPSNHLAHHALAAAQFFRKDIPAFRVAAQRAIDLNPMDGFTIAYLGFLIAYAGDWERGRTLLAKARGLNPYHPGWYWFVPCFDAYRKGDYRLALEFAQKVNMPGFWRTNMALAAIYGQLDQREAARNALESLLEVRPGFAASSREDLAIWWQPDLVEHLIDGLRKAGLQIPAGETGLHLTTPRKQAS